MGCLAFLHAQTKRMLRVFVSNAASGSQAANARSSMDTADESAGNETSMATDEEMSGWTLRVQGKLMEASHDLWALGSFD